MKRKIFAATGLAAAALLMSAVSFGATKAEIDERVHVAMHQFYELNPQHKDLVARAKGVLVFPRITKGGVGVAGEFGEGALRIDGKNVAYYSVSSASVGLTLGLAKHKEVILFMTQDALDKFRTAMAGRSARTRMLPCYRRVRAANTIPRRCNDRSSASCLAKRV